MAATLGLYASADQFLLSLVAVGPGLAGVAVGRRIGPSLPVRYQRVGTVALLLAIGIRLTARGLSL